MSFLPPPTSVPQPLSVEGRTALVVDPHGIAREGLKALLHARLHVGVVIEAGDGRTALALAEEHKPNLVVLEAVLPVLDGAQVAARLCTGQGRPMGERPRVLVLTGYERPGMARLLLGMGARGYVLKRSPTERLVEALRAVAAGGKYVDPGIPGWAPHGGSNNDGLSTAALTERELAILVLNARGYSNKEISAKLQLSLKTVEVDKSRTKAKLDLHTHVDVVRLVAVNGWMAEPAS